MKINFWQILGGVLLLLGVTGLVYEKYFAGPQTPKQGEVRTVDSPSVPTTLPVSTTATAPAP